MFNFNLRRYTMGTVTLKPACKTEGFGKISGIRHCSDGEDAAGYELTAQAGGY